MNEARVGGAEGCGTGPKDGLVRMSEEQARRLVVELEKGNGGPAPVVVAGPAVPDTMVKALEARGMRVVRSPDLDEQRLDEQRFGPPPIDPAMRLPRGKLTTVVLGPSGKPARPRALDPAKGARVCGGCDACCATLGVRGVPNAADGPGYFVHDKQPHTRCVHQTAAGCAIHDRPTGDPLGRAAPPQSCRDYRCAWLEGQGDDGDRPDRSGLILDAPGGGAVRAREVFRGAFDRARVKARLRELHLAGLTVRLIPYKGRKLPVGKPL